jgi:hypothetical protein
MTKWILICATALAFLGSPRLAYADTVNITVDTTSLAGLSGRFEFDLFDGDGLLNNMATISNIATNGVAGPVDCTIGCTGGPPYTLDDSLGFANILLDLTLGSTFSFDLTFSNNYSFGPADQLVLFLLDPNTNFSLLDTSLDLPFGDALALINLDGTQLNIQTADAGVSVTAVPEPATFLLLSLCLPMLLLRKQLLRTNS